MDVAGEGEELFQVYHLHPLVPGRRRAFFKVQLLVHRDAEHEKPPPVPPGHQRFEHPFPENRVIGAAETSLHILKFPHAVGDAGGVQQPQGVGFRLSAHLPMTFVFSTASMMASAAAARKALRSNVRTPWMVEPPGEHTASLRAPGWRPSA